MKVLDARPLDGEEVGQLDAWWRAANYLAVGQIYLLANPLLREPLQPDHVKARLLGHWGTSPGLNLIQAHLNRVIAARDLDCLYVFGPGHGGPAAVAYAPAAQYAPPAYYAPAPVARPRPDDRHWR